MMQTAEEFARNCAHMTPVGLAHQIEERDNATRLAGALEALASLENRIREQFIRNRSGSEWRQILPILLREQEAKFNGKYTQPVQPTRAPARGCPRCHDEEAQFLDGQCQTCGEPSK